MRTEEEFIEWLQGGSIYIGHDRYGKFGHGFLCASLYEENDELEEAVSMLDAGDFDAANAAEQIEAQVAWCVCHKDPAEAMRQLVEKMRIYYFNELNK